MDEIIFIVKESEEGGFVATALGVSIITEGESMEELRTNVKESVLCHFDIKKPRIIRLHMIREEVFSV